MSDFNSFQTKSLQQKKNEIDEQIKKLRQQHDAEDNVFAEGYRDREFEIAKLQEQSKDYQLHIKHEQDLKQTYGEVFEEREKTDFRVGDLSTMKAKEVIRYEQRVVKKGLVKNEYETVPVVDEKATMEKRQDNARRMKDAGADLLADQKSIVESFPTTFKEKIGDQAAMDLAAFTDIFDEKFSMMTALKRMGQDKYNKYTVLDKLTESIMNINPSVYELSDDGGIVANANNMETIIMRLKAYESITDPEYFKAFDEKKKNALDKHIAELKDLTNYYRIRKAIISDPLYASHSNTQMDLEIKDTDTAGMKHLKTMMRTSYAMAQRLAKNSGNSIELPKLKSVSKESQNAQAHIDDLMQEDVTAQQIEQEVSRLENISRSMTPPEMS